MYVASKNETKYITKKNNTMNVSVGKANLKKKKKKKISIF